MDCYKYYEVNYISDSEKGIEKELWFNTYADMRMYVREAYAFAEKEYGSYLKDKSLRVYRMPRAKTTHCVTIFKEDKQWIKKVEDWQWLNGSDVINLDEKGNAWRMSIWIKRD